MRWKLAYIFALVWVMFCAPVQLWSYAVTQPTIAWRQTYTYDAMGRRVSRTTYQNEVASTTVYVSAGMQEVAEYTDSSDAAAPSRTYVYGSYVDEPVQVRVFASATTQPASTQNATTQPSYTDYYYHTNALYSVIAVADTAGAVVERYTYDAYGQRTITDADGAPRAESILGNEIGFTGRRLDPLTNQYYFRARYYDAAQGRFISRDPLEYVDGMSLYGGYYVPNGLDPDGEQLFMFASPPPMFLGGQPGETIGEIVTETVAGTSRWNPPPYTPRVQPRGPGSAYEITRGPLTGRPTPTPPPGAGTGTIKTPPQIPPSGLDPKTQTEPKNEPTERGPQNGNPPQNPPEKKTDCPCNCRMEAEDVANMMLKIYSGWDDIPKQNRAFNTHIEAAEHEWANGLNTHTRKIALARGSAISLDGVGLSHLSEVRNDCRGLRNKLEALRLCVVKCPMTADKHKQLLKDSEFIKGRCLGIAGPSYDEQAACRKNK